MRNKVFLCVLALCFLFTGYGCGKNKKVDYEGIEAILTTNVKIPAKDTITLTSPDSAKRFNLDVATVERGTASYSMMHVKTDEFLLVEAIKGQEDEVKKKLEQYLKTKAVAWKDYLPEQYDLIKNAVLLEKEQVFVIIISPDANKVKELLLPYFE